MMDSTINHGRGETPRLFQPSFFMQEEYTFDHFWNDYQKKVGKQNAIKQWKKLSDKDKMLIKKHVSIYVTNREKQYRKDPERYLKHRTFEDEIIPAGEVKKQTHSISSKAVIMTEQEMIDHARSKNLWPNHPAYKNLGNGNYQYTGID